MTSRIWSRGDGSKRNCRKKECGEKGHGGRKGGPTFGQQLRMAGGPKEWGRKGQKNGRINFFRA